MNLLKTMIKLFEEFGQNTFYQMDSRRAVMLTNSPFLDLEEFTHKEVDILHKYYPFVEYPIKEGTIYVYSRDIVNNNNNYICDIRCYKMPDEWYFVWVQKIRFHDEYYMCDQLEGLEDCLKMTKNNED